jgi:hypothetical protein
MQSTAGCPMNAVQPHCKDCTRLLCQRTFWDGSFSCPRRHAAEFDNPPPRVATIGSQRNISSRLIDHGLAVKAKRDALGLPGAVVVIGWIGKVAFRIRGSSTIRHSGKATDANFSLCFSCTLLQRRFAAISYHTFLRSSK